MTNANPAAAVGVAEPVPALDTQVISLRWVLRLRWAAIFGQSVTALVVVALLGISLPLEAMGAILGLATLTNLVALFASRRQPPREGWVAALMVFDVVALTALLFLTGGPTNPFSFLYLVPIALATLVLRPAWTWGLVLLSLIGSAVLFVEHRPIEALEGHAEHMKVHLRGMWVAFGVAAGFIVYFLLRVRRALALRDEALAHSHEVAARQRRVAALATLAAGAAHELATPLGTIAVVSHELARRFEHEGSPDRSDLVLIRSEVDRCRTILNRMSYPTQWRDHGAGGAGASSGGEAVGGASSHGGTVRQAVAGAEAALGAPPWLRTEVAPSLGDLRAASLDEAFVQALSSVLRNAHEASAAETPVVLSVERWGAEGPSPSSSTLVFRVRDRGQGMDAALLARVGEPFFTTKPQGRGMGLGLFLARAVVERWGGSLHIESEVGRGSVVTLEVPCEGAHD